MGTLTQYSRDMKLGTLNLATVLANINPISGFRALDKVFSVKMHFPIGAKLIEAGWTRPHEYHCPIHELERLFHFGCRRTGIIALLVFWFVGPSRSETDRLQDAQKFLLDINGNRDRRKMIPTLGSRDFQAKLEDATDQGKFLKAPSSSRQWSAFRNPRIVRVSRSFGGKDRHSKVCTVRGLRDRRIRLSVPTAIQLYDLQDRLGLSQPSKVIDWLLDVTKHDIDKLPPLQIPPGSLGQFHQTMFASPELGPSQSLAVHFCDPTPTFLKEVGSHSLSAMKEGIRIGNNVDEEDQDTTARSKYWDNEALMRAKSKEVVSEAVPDKTKWFRINEQENQDGIGGYSSQVSAQNLFTVTNLSPLPGLLNNSGPYNSCHWDPSSLSLSQFGSHGFPSQSVASHNNAAVPLPSPLAVSSGSQLFFCPTANTPPLFPPRSSYITTQEESNPRCVNHVQLLSSSSSSQHMLPNSLMPSLHSVGPQMKSFPMNANSRLLHSQNNDESHPNKGT